MKIRETWTGLLLLLMATSAPAGEPQSFKLAALKLIPKSWDKDAIFAKLEAYARRAAVAGAALVVTPEGYLEGYVGNTKFSEDLSFERYLGIAEPIDGPYLARAQEPKELQLLDIERLRRERQKTRCTLKGKPETTRTLSPATIRAALTLLKRICSFGVKSGYCAPLPFSIQMPKVSNIVIEDLNEEQLKRLLAAIEADDNADARGIMRMALYTGMRRGELFKLKWEDVDFDRGFIRIMGPKGGTDQTIPLNAAARKVLEAHRRTSEYIFPGEDGGPRVTVQKARRPIREAAGLPNTFRPLHGGCAMPLYPVWQAPAQSICTSLQTLLTHKSPAMTQRYAHLRDEALKRASELAGTLVGEVRERNRQSS